MIDEETRELLKCLADRYETAEFIVGDPSWWMHQVSGSRNQEATAFVASGLSYGSRSQFMPKIGQLLEWADGDMDRWLREGGYRRLKLTGDNQLLDVNADFMATYTLLNEPTLYPSAYMVLTNKGYTKHYYAGTERVAARLGGGGLNALYYVIGNNDTLQGKADSLFDQSLEQVNERILDENNLDCIMQNEFAIEEFGLWIDGIPYQMQADVEFDHSQFRDVIYSMLDNPNGGMETEVYFYHSDHLGSASWITDSIGIPIQHLQYLPYGEPYVDQRHAGATYSERFRFTGKERDEETGYGYFGARYMDHELMTMWLSVDPLADKYPSISPYAYCAWNPVKLVDPDGREIWLPSGKEYKANMDATGLDESDAAVVNALNEICKSDEGLLMINKLCSPGNEINVDLTHGETKNTATGPKESFYDEGTGIPGTGLNINVDIEWNLNNPEAIPTVEGMQVNATYNLLDEICHAYDYCT